MNIVKDQHQEGSTLELVLFKAGQFRFGLEASRVRGSGEFSTQNVPTAEALLALSEETADRCRKCLIIRGDEQDYEISVAAPFELRSIPAESVYPLPTALYARCRLPGLRALAILARECIMLITVHTLLQSLKPRSSHVADHCSPED